jgi:micrococcal nuclease
MPRMKKFPYCPALLSPLGKTVLLLLLPLLLAAPAAAQSEPPWIGHVVKVIDGDSLIVQSGGEKVEVRLYGVDAPEYRQPYGKDAMAFIQQMAGKGTEVKLYPKGKDKHGREVARVFVGKKELNLEIIRAGFAWWYARYAPLMSVYYNAQNEAKANHRGLWTGADPTPPWVWRKKNPPPPRKKSLIFDNKEEAGSHPD